uniref:TPR_REGION domain-containing protein n=1 Tax=Schistosoma mansoni TaxID=6183 RepID=A0A3Q0KUD7_SCHMA
MSQLIKQARELYKAEKFEECYKLTGELLVNSKDYGTLVMHGACCSQIGNEKEAIKSYFSALSIDSTNNMAWIGLYNETKKSPDKNRRILLRVCTALIGKCSKSDSTGKYLEYAKMLVQIVVQFRLPLPFDFNEFNDICEFILEHDPDNLYALEATFRLQIEYFLFYGFPEFMDQSLCSKLKFENITQQSKVPCITSSAVYLKRSKQFEQILEIVQQPTDVTKTAHITLCLSQLLYRLYIYFIPNYSPTNSVEDSNNGNDEKYSDLWNLIQNDINKLDFNGVVGFINSSKNGIIDLHAGLLYVLAAFKLYQFNSCSEIINTLISFIDRNCTQFYTESESLSEPISKFISYTSNLNFSQRTLCTPFRFNLNGLEDNDLPTKYNIYTIINSWLRILYMANICNSEISTKSTDGNIEMIFRQLANTKYIPSTWIDVYQTLYLEYYLIVNNLEAAFSILEKWKIHHGCQMNETVPNSIDLSPRFRICLIWLKVSKFISTKLTNDSDTTIPQPIVNEFLDLLKTNNLTVHSTRYQYLIGYIMKMFTQSITNYPETMGCDQQLNAFSLGVQFDKCYYANYLQLGHIHREMESFKEALTSYAEAYRLMPGSPVCAYYYSVALCKQEQWENALDVYSYIDHNDFTKDMWLNYGLINLRLGRINDCLPALQRVVLAKNDALYWEILGEAYLFRRSYETAVKAFNRALDLEPNRPFTLVLCGRAYRHMNDIYSSLCCFNNALKMIEDNYMIDRLYRKFYVLIMKELVEIHIFKCQSGMYQGCTGQALNDLHHTLTLLNKLLNYFVGSKVVPFWFFRYTGDILSLLSMIDDPELLIDVPTRLVSLMNGAQYLSESKKPTETIKVNIVTCLHLGGIYLACALRTSISSIRYPSHSLDPNVLSSNKDTESSTSTTTTTSTTKTDPLKLLIISSILISLGINQLNQGYYIQRNNISPESFIKTNQLDHIVEPFNFIMIPNELFYLSESTLKNALQLLDNLSSIYGELLEEILKEKSLHEPSTITTDDEIDEQDIRDRINLIKKLQSRAWASLAGVYSTSDENLDSEITYCLCQALLYNPDNTTVMVNLAMLQMKQGQTELAVNLVEQAKAINPDNFRVWLVSAQLTAVMSGTPSIGPGLLVNTEVLSHLIHAAYTGSNYQVASQLTLHLMPIIIEYSGFNFLCDPSASSCPSKDMSQLIQVFDKRAHLRLSINVAIECLNRAIAFQPNNIRLWHNRGILLQLVGYSVPAKHCLQKAVMLLNKQNQLSYRDNPNELAFFSLVLSHYFLITYICGSPDWKIAEQLLNLTKNPNSTFCHSLAEACAKGIIFTMHPDHPAQENLSLICLTEEIQRLPNQGSFVTKSALQFQPNAGFLLLLVIKLINCPYFGPMQEIQKLHTYLNGIMKQAQLFTSSSSSSTDQYYDISLPLAYNLSQIGVRLGQDIDWLMNSPLCKLIYEISSKKQMEYENLSNLPDLFTNRISDNYLPLGGQLTENELNNWIMNNTYLSLCSSRKSSGLAYISRYLIQRPNESIRWMFLFSWLLHKNPISQTTNLSTIELKQSMNTSMETTLTIYTNLIIKCLLCINQLRNECPMNSIFATALVNFSSWWLTVNKDYQLSVQYDDLYTNLLLNLRRAAVLFPDTPNILSTLQLISEKK